MLRLFASLRSRLLLLVLLAVLPAIGLSLYMAIEQRRLAIAEVQADAARLTLTASFEEEQLISTTRQLLVALAQIAEVRQGDPQRCSALLANLLDQYQRYANLGVAGPAGEIFCSALPLNQSVNIADLSYFQRAYQTKSFVIGDYQVGRISGEPSIHFGYPILNESGEVQAVIYAAVNLLWLNQQGTEIDSQLPPGSTFTKLDTNGRVLVQIPKLPQQLGQLMPEAALLKAVLQSGHGSVEMPGADGQRRLYTFSSMRSQLYGGDEYLIVGVPSLAVFGGVTQALLRNLASLGLVALLTLAVAWFGSDLVVLRPMRILVETTRHLAGGDLTARTGLPYHSGEVGQLALAFDEMANTLARLVTVERRSHQTTETLREASAALTSTLDLQPVLDNILVYLAKVVPYDRASVLLLMEDRLQQVAGRGFAAASETAVAYPADSVWFAQLQHTRQPLIVADQSTEPNPESLELSPRPNSNWMGVPLIVRGELIGSLTLEQPPATPYGPAEAALAQTFANQAAVAIHNAQLFDAVQQKSAELRALAARLAEAQETERKKIARELHDQIGQNLTVLSVSMNLVRLQFSEVLGDSGRTRLEEALKLVEQTTRDIRDVMADLRPSVLDDYGLMAALRWYGPHFAKQTGVAVVVTGEELAPRLPALAETALFRIVQEALTNVARHAQATQVLLTLQAEGEVARLVIADDGQGFVSEAPRPPGHGWGLINMRERAQAVGGRLQVESLPGEGTHVIVEVPR
jgi:signal transduction histidine kinase